LVGRPLLSGCKAETALDKTNEGPQISQQTFMFLSSSTFLYSFDVNKTLVLVKG
jgi:hypothetical protein